METIKLRAMLARAPGLTAEHVRDLFAVTGEESSLCDSAQRTRIGFRWLPATRRAEAPAKASRKAAQDDGDDDLKDIEDILRKRGI